MSLIACNFNKTSDNTELCDSLLVKAPIDSIKIDSLNVVLDSLEVKSDSIK
jgi:hypothetical protein